MGRHFIYRYYTTSNLPLQPLASAPPPTTSLGGVTAQASSQRVQSAWAAQGAPQREQHRREQHAQGRNALVNERFFDSFLHLQWQGHGEGGSR